TMLVLTWIAFFRGAVGEGDFSDGFAGDTSVVRVAGSRSPLLRHHFQKNHPDNARAATKRTTSTKRRKRFGGAPSSAGSSGGVGWPRKGLCCWACFARFKASLIKLIRLFCLPIRGWRGPPCDSQYPRAFRYIPQGYNC